MVLNAVRTFPHAIYFADRSPAEGKTIIVRVADRPSAHAVLGEAFDCSHDGGPLAVNRWSLGHTGLLLSTSVSLLILSRRSLCFEVRTIVFVYQSTELHLHEEDPGLCDREPEHSDECVPFSRL